MELAIIQNLLQENCKSDISKYNNDFVYRVIQERCNAIGMVSISEYALYLPCDRREAEILYEHLNINYTDFFRDALLFAQLQDLVLPELIAGKAKESELRIWSAGCSSGQEPYSVAMIIEEYFKANNSTPHYRIIATDRSERQLDIAIKGRYSEESIRNIKVKFVDEYFLKNGNTYQINHSLSKNIDFTFYDLMERGSLFPRESIYGNFDLVMCCNVLFYYQKKYQEFLIKKLIRSVKNGGYLIVGNAEKHLAKKYGSLKATCESSCIFQKVDRGTI